MTNLEIIIKRLSMITDVLAVAPELSSWAFCGGGEVETEGAGDFTWKRRDAHDVEFGYVKDGIETTIKGKELSLLNIRHAILGEDIVLLCKRSVPVEHIETAVKTRLAEIELDGCRKYKAIVFWGEQLGSYCSYVKQQQIIAFRENAPLNAIYKKDNGEWETLDQVQNQAVIEIAKKRGLL